MPELTFLFSDSLLVAQYRASQDTAALKQDIEGSETVQELDGAYSCALAEDADLSEAEQQARVATLAGRVSVATTQ